MITKLPGKHNVTLDCFRIRPIGMVVNSMPGNPDVIPPQKCPILWAESGSHLILSSLGPPNSTPQMPSRLVQPSLMGSWSLQTDRPTVCSNRLHLASGAIR